MGWRFKWVSSNGTDFNFDYHVSFTKGELQKGDVEYNYRMQKLGSETPKGRDEAGPPHGMAWVRHHDRYASK